MIRILISDTHFGWKQNSVTWLNSQMRFIDEQLIPFIRKCKDEVRLIHLGDVFDSRSSISPMIAKTVRERFIKLASMVKDFYIIAGNHDFYSPITDEYDTLSLVFRDCGIKLVIKEVVTDGEDMFVPWYCYKQDLSDKLAGIHNIYTHADIFGEDLELTSKYNRCNIFSGHIHIPRLDENKRLYNLGSCYSLNFADANWPRFAYVWSYEKLKPIENKSSIRFWRIRNDDFFSDLHDTNDYYEFYIKQIDLQSPKYQERAKEIAKKYKNYNIIPVVDEMIIEYENVDVYDIEEICKQSIPEHLRDKFQKIIEIASST